MPRAALPFVLSQQNRDEIEQWLAAMGTPQQVALRCLIVLGAAGGQSEAAIAGELEINRKTVRLWKERFTAQGLAVHLADQVRRNLAGPEAGHPDLRGEAFDLRLDLRLDILGGDGQHEGALQALVLDLDGLDGHVAKVLM